MISGGVSNKWPEIDPDLRESIIPVFWVEIQAEATEEDTEVITGSLYPAQDAERVLSSWWVLLLGVVVLLAGSLLILVRRRIFARCFASEDQDSRKVGDITMAA